MKEQCVYYCDDVEELSCAFLLGIVRLNDGADDFRIYTRSRVIRVSEEYSTATGTRVYFYTDGTASMCFVINGHNYFEVMERVSVLCNEF